MKENEERVDEIEKYYKAPKKIGVSNFILFWILATTSLVLPFIVDYPVIHKYTSRTFMFLIVIYFFSSMISKLYLVPKAESKRKKQFLSNSLGVNIIIESTKKYYNNTLKPSFIKLAANTMENAFFSNSVIAKMLIKRRVIIGLYLLLWLGLFIYKIENIHFLIWITQTLFTTELVLQWVSLEILLRRYKNVYKSLYNHFLNNVGAETNVAKACIIDLFSDYEAAKSSAGILLSSKIFNKMNDELTEEWVKIRSKLKMDE
ncbi:MAG: hypothetical protein PF574_03965 [Candidatus Delongbacteria bacterium]|jgi:hypothetical protein|nr:hypothetical protein [Candidatus Delongbacteria bacterium]